MQNIATLVQNIFARFLLKLIYRKSNGVGAKPFPELEPFASEDDISILVGHFHSRNGRQKWNGIIKVQNSISFLCVK